MKSSWSKTPRRLLLIGGALALAASTIGAGVAFATPAGPPGASTAVVLADGTFVNTINANTNLIKLRTRDQVEVFQVSQTAQAGFTSGWHSHTGPILVNITAGSMKFYAADCTETTVTAGHGYFETPGEPILVRNEGSVTAAWITTQIIPVGGSRRVDVLAARCGVQ
jgi:quercetin dioxygenase-like cupin family protein